jgi:serine/threonine protein kinase
LGKGDYESYWKRTGGETLSSEFKDLIVKMFSYDASKRPTLKEIADHPWMQTGCDVKKVQSSLLSELNEKRSQAT